MGERVESRIAVFERRGMETPPYKGSAGKPGGGRQKPGLVARGSWLVVRKGKRQFRVESSESGKTLSVEREAIYSKDGFELARRLVMKMIIAIIRPEKLQQTKQALSDAGVTGITVSDVRGHGRQKSHTEYYRGAEYQVDLLPKARLDIAAPDEMVSKIINVIVTCAQTGRMGDGKIFIMPIEEVVRVRTGEVGDGAL